MNTSDDNNVANAVHDSTVSGPPPRTSGFHGRNRRNDARQAVQQASSFLRNHAAEGVRVAHLTSVTGISERTLRNAFHRVLGLSPKQFDLRERLNAARGVLCDAGNDETVTTIATRFGFFELGRFARLYKNAFGESPSQTRKDRRVIEGSGLQRSFGGYGG